MGDGTTSVVIIAAELLLGVAWKEADREMQQKSTRIITNHSNVEGKEKRDSRKVKTRKRKHKSEQ